MKTWPAFCGDSPIVIIGFALVLFVTFYLLMDGGTLAEKLASLSPLPSQNQPAH